MLMASTGILEGGNDNTKSKSIYILQKVVFKAVHLFRQVQIHVLCQANVVSGRRVVIPHVQGQVVFKAGFTVYTFTRK